MAKNSRKMYKRSVEAPVALTEQHKKDAKALEISSNIIKWGLIAVVLLAIIFSMLALVTATVDNKDLDLVANGKDKFANISSFDVIGAWYDTASFNYPKRNIVVGKPFVHAFDYIVDRVPALNAAAATGAGGDQIFAALSPKQDAMLDSAYVGMLVVEVISLIWLVAMALVFVLTFFKKLAPTQTIINIMGIVFFVLTMIMFAFTLGMSASTAKEEQFKFTVGIGMWLNVLVSVIYLSVIVANMIYSAKVKNHENLALSMRR